MNKRILWRGCTILAGVVLAGTGVLSASPYDVARHRGKGANLRGVTLVGADLKGANLAGANLTGADLWRR